MAVEQASRHPWFRYFPEAGEDAWQSFLGVPLIDRGVLQGVIVLQTAAAQVAPIVSEARSPDRFIAPSQEKLWGLARNLWWIWDQESTALFRDLYPARWRSLNATPLETLEQRAGELVLHGRINYAYRRQQEY